MAELFILVIVESGIPVRVEVFKSLEEANTMKDSLLPSLNMEDDEITIFTKNIDGFEI